MNEHAHDNYIERHEDRVNAIIRQQLDNLIVRRIGKDAFAVERKDNCNNYHIVDGASCNCAWSVFIPQEPCIHILAVNRYLDADNLDIPF